LQVALLIVAIFAAMLALRLVWIWATFLLAQRRTKPDPMPSWRLIAATSLAGSRGAIIFAGILTLPVVLPVGQPFAERDLMILIAMGVIVLSLIVAATGLPLLLQSETAAPPAEVDDTAARTATATAALAEITRISALHTAPDAQAGCFAAATTQVSRRYLQRLDALGQPGVAPMVHPGTQVLLCLQLAAVRAERKSVLLMRRQRTIGATTARKMVRELDLLEAHFEA
jgi:CPA1 family monovalent cation:H+ antiporter